MARQLSGNHMPSVSLPTRAIRTIWRYPTMKMNRRWTQMSIATVAALAATQAFGQILTASCLDNTVKLVVEEARLPNTLPDNADPSKLQTKSFAQQMIEGAGFQDF